MKNKILVVGDLILDEYIYGNVERISQEAAIPIVNINSKNSLKSVLGGAANVASNIKSLGADVKLIGIIGNCEDSKKLKKLLKNKKINNSLLTLKKFNLTKKTRILNGHNHIIRLDKDPLNFTYDQKLIENKIKSNLKNTKIIIISDYNKGTVNNLKKIIAIGKKNKIQVFVDSKKKNIEEFSDSYLVKPNEKEFKELFSSKIKNKYSNTKILKLMKFNKINNLLLTLGKNGMKLFSNNKVQNYYSTKKNVYDVTGAGDTVIASIASNFLETKNLNLAVEFSMKAAEIAIMKVGTSVVYKKEIYNHDSTINNKIIGMKKLLNEIKNLKKQNKKIIFTNGCFDLLHPGHLHILRESKKKGDILVIGLNSDSSVKKNKGQTRPIINQLDRAKSLADLNYVDFITIFNEKTPLNIIKAIKPNILTKGKDYKNKIIVGREFVIKSGGKISLIPIYKNYSTTSYLSKI